MPGLRSSLKRRTPIGVPRATRADRTMRFSLAVALVSALLQMASVTPIWAAWRTGCRVDRAQYASLARGMTYRQVRSRLGCDGRRVSHLLIGDVQRATYSWLGRGSYGANLTITFRNDRLTDKSQLGLRPD
ncbi:DUF3862 domain-containing protein [Methylobacterium mesophilicum]|uniref:DUF3862 domain-containing protein n=1 Tax=Methylobacterium mesophilicum TaxID=39956 RepID=UPI002F35050B